MNSPKDEAYQYLKRGWSVIELMYRDKLPMGEWHRWLKERPTPAHVSGWRKNANVGIVTGKITGLAVIDFDPKNGADAAVQEEFLLKYPTGLTVRTGSGGLHAYYKIPDGCTVRNSVQAIGAGIDTRGEGGMVVAPPSTHPDTGRQYEWESTGEPGEFPVHLQTELAQETHRNVPGWVEKALAGGVPEGGRDEMCSKLAGHFFRTGLSQAVCTTILTDWGKKCQPEYTENLVLKTINSVWRKAIRDLSDQSSASRSTSSESSSSGFQLMSFEKFMEENADQDDTKWLVEGWLPDKTVCFVISPPGTYKSWLTMDLCISVATGTPFLNQFKVEGQGPVFLLQQEDFAGQTATRLSIIANTRFDQPSPVGEGEFEVWSPPKVPIFIHTERQFRFDQPVIMKDFADAVRLHRPRLVVLDPLYSATATDDFMASTAGHLLNFKNLRDECGTTFVICHHTNKSGGDSERQRAWGSQFLNAALETGWQVSRAKAADTICVKRHFKAAADPPSDLTLHWNIVTEGDEGKQRYVCNVKTTEDKDRRTKDDEILQDDPEEKAITTPMAPGPPEVGSVKEKILRFLEKREGEYLPAADIAAETGVNQTSVHRQLTKLTQEGFLEKKGTAYGFPPARPTF